MILATHAKEIQTKITASENIDVIEKYINWAANEGRSFTTAFANEEAVKTLLESGYRVERSIVTDGLYFIHW